MTTTNTLPQQTEKQFQQAVITYARMRGYRCYHTHDSRRSEPGFPDLVMVKEGRCIMAELKRQTGRVSPAQAEWIALLKSAGVEIYVWRPSNWDEIEGTL